MTDRQLLEDAARAAGYVETCVDERGWFRVRADPSHSWKIWNPLEDDGDALRLAVKLRCLPIIEDWSDGPWVFAPLYPECAEPLGDNPSAATRRAITRAAAEIGRAGDE